jgi:cytoskeleton protein RodZ
MAGVGTGFGEELRAERERRGISLETLCAHTKVNPRHLSSLEEGNYGALPGGVFRRGIVRAYLSAVGLDEQMWMARFETSYAEQARALGVENETDWTTFAVNVKRNRTLPRPGNRARWLGVLAMLLVLAAAGFAVWHYVLGGQVHLSM